MTSKGSGLTSAHIHEGQELCPPRLLLPHCHMPSNSLRTPGTEGEALYGFCRGWVGELASMEQRSRQGWGTTDPRALQGGGHTCKVVAGELP